MATEPTSTAGAASKVLSLMSFVAVSVIAFVLGVQVIPLDNTDPHRDMVRRLLGCAVSSLAIGLPALAFVQNPMPWMFSSIGEVFVMLDLPATFGQKLITWSILLVAAIPGWWLVGSYVRQAAGWQGKTMKEIKEEVL